MAPSDALRAAVDTFVDELGGRLDQICAALPDADREQLRHDVALEAFNLAAGFVGADDRLTDDELRAIIGTFGGRLTNADLARATPADLRASGLLAGRTESLREPSPLYLLLLDADRRDGTDHAVAYRNRAVALGHVVASLDAFPSEDELRAVERLRRLLDQTREGALARPGPTTEAGAGVERAQPEGGGGDSTGADDATEAEPEPPARPLEEVLAELDALVGLDEVKREVHLVTDLLQVQRLRAERGLPVHESSRHLVFTGNPGTGKTTVARLLAEVYRALGVVERGHLVERDRSALVAGFVGQTAPRMVAAFDEADEGVLLIDEAQALARGGERDFGREAIDTLVKLVEDRRDRVVVIVAGYPDEMEAFLDANPGLRSRFPRTIAFPDYGDDELVQVLEHQAERSGYRLSPDARAAARRWFAAQPREKGFGNGRTARNLFEDLLERHAQRVVGQDEPTDHVLVTLEAEDVPAA